MKQFDPVSAVYGVVFIAAGLYFADGSRQPSFGDLGLLLPVVLIAIGSAVIVKNRRKDG